MDKLLDNQYKEDYPFDPQADTYIVRFGLHILALKPEDSDC